MAPPKPALLLALAAVATAQAGGWFSRTPDPPRPVGPSWIGRNAPAGGSTAGLCILASDGAGHLFLVAPETGISRDLGQLQDQDGEPVAGGLTDVAYDPADGSAYAVTFDTLYAVDLEDPSRSRRIGAMGGHDINALVVAPDGRLLGASTGGGFFEIDRGSGEATRLGRLGDELSSSGDLAFHQGALYATSPGPGGSDQLLELDPATGAARVIGILGGPEGPESNVYGLVSRGDTLFGLTEGGRVYAIDPATGALEPSSTTEVAFWGATGLAEATPDR